MSLAIFANVTVGWVPDGSGPEFLPSAQALTVYVPPQIIAGGNAPTSTQISAACSTIGTLAAAQFNSTTNLAAIDGWNAGNP